MPTLQFTHRFAGPCHADGVTPYARPDLLGIYAICVDGGRAEIPHGVLRFGRAGPSEFCLDYRSENDPEVEAFWSGGVEELRALLVNGRLVHELFVPEWRTTFRLSVRAWRVLVAAVETSATQRTL
jgi:hypothetical protein